LWKNNIQDGLAEKKEQLKTLKQEEIERVMDFKIRIDDYYKMVFGEGAAKRENVTVVASRNQMKKTSY
jgi:hypothetical protein